MAKTPDPLVLDISHWQTDPNWQELRSAGIVGVIFKATESTDYFDPTFSERYEGALAAGLAVSSYHFLRPGDIVDQMNFYLNAVDPRLGERVVLDWEDDAVTLGELHDAVQYLRSDSRRLQITIYGSSSFLNDKVGTGKKDVILAKCALWVASYTTAASPSSWPKATWPNWSLWQYTDKASVSGYGPVDGNRFNGTPEKCVEWIGPAGAAPEPRPKPEPEEIVVTVHVSVQAPPGVRVNVVVD